jgi:hypothetical protein
MPPQSKTVARNLGAPASPARTPAEFQGDVFADADDDEDENEDKDGSRTTRTA